MKQLLRLNTLICTLFIFLTVGILASIPAQFEVLDPVGKALADFEITDLVYSKIRSEQPSDTNIVLVNIASLNRKEIAKQIRTLNKFEPKIIAVDAFFRSKKEFEQDVPLLMSLADVDNLVMVSQVVDPNADATCFDSVQTSHPQFNQFATNGFANFKTGSSDGYRTVRSFVPLHCAEDSIELSFAAEVVRLYDTTAFQKLLDRDRELETINWLGNKRKFTRLDYNEVLDDHADLGFIKDKIVLLGYMGEYLGHETLDDVFFTPLNPEAAGRSYPDMYGVTVHANIISMILRDNYINTSSQGLNILMAFILVYLNVALFLFIGEHYKVYFDLITKSIILAELAIVFFVSLYSLARFNVKIDLTIAFVGLVFSGDLTELYVGSLQHIGKNVWNKLLSLFKKTKAAS